MSKTKTIKKKIHVKLLSQYCKGCGLCVNVCEQRKLSLDATPNERGVLPVSECPDIACNVCLKCVAMCPEGAIEIYEEKNGK